MNLPDNLKYSEEHEWIKVEGDIATIGITDFAQSELGEIVYIEMDSLEETLDKGEVFGTVEAVKTTSELFMPISGEIIEFNPEIDEDEGDDPSLLNADPYGDGWIIKVRMSNKEELQDLLNAEGYKEFID